MYLFSNTQFSTVLPLYTSAKFCCSIVHSSTSENIVLHTMRNTVYSSIIFWMRDVFSTWILPKSVLRNSETIHHCLLPLRNNLVTILWAFCSIIYCPDHLPWIWKLPPWRRLNPHSSLSLSLSLTTSLSARDFLHPFCWSWTTRESGVQDSMGLENDEARGSLFLISALGTIYVICMR